MGLSPNLKNNNLEYLTSLNLINKIENKNIMLNLRSIAMPFIYHGLFKFISYF